MKLRNLLHLKQHNVVIIGSIEPVFFYRASPIMVDFIEVYNKRGINQALNHIKAIHSPVEVKDFNDRLVRNKHKLFIQDNNIRTTIPKSDAGISMLTLNLSRRCNLKCTYCFEDDDYRKHRDMTFDTAKKAVDSLLLDTSSKCCIIFTGGEPLLNYNVLKEIVQYVNAQDIDVEYRLKTNGTLLDDDKMDFLIENKFKVQISIDGNKDTHDKHRKHLNGDGSFELVDNAIRSFINKGYSSSITLAGVYTKNTVKYIDNSFKHLSKYGDCEYEIKPIMQNSSDKYCLDSHDYKILTEVARTNPTIFNQISKMNSVGSRICGIGIWNVTVDFDGKIYPCYRMCGNEKFIIGKLDSFELPFTLPEELKEVYTLGEKFPCNSCYMLSLCLKGCYADKVMHGMQSDECVNPMKLIMENIVLDELFTNQQYMSLELI